MIYPKDADIRWLYLDFNSYFASVEQQVHPELRGRPVAVVPVMTERTCAIAASYEAKAYGIKTGTMIYEARKRCPELICVQARHDQYVEYHHRLLEVIDQFLPIEQVLSVDELACRFTGSQQNETKALSIARAIKRGIAEQVGAYIRCSIGIAPNRYLAKIATELQKPDGLVVLRKRDLPEKLYTLKLGDLTGIGYGMEHRLRMAGVGSIRDLWQLSPKHMRRIWHSVAGERFYHMLRGDEVPDIPTRRRTVGHSHVLDPEWRPLPRANIVAKRLVQKAASRLRRLGFYAQSMVLSIRLEQGARLATEQRFYRACDHFTLLGVLQSLWDRVTADFPAQMRIKKVSVTLLGLVPASELQPELALTPQVDSRPREAASLAMDKLNERFGRDTVVTGYVPQPQHRFSGTKIAFTRIPDRAEFHE